VEELSGEVVVKKTRWAWAVGTFFGVGYMKPGPGTYASLATVLLWWGAANLLHIGPHNISALTFLAMIVVTAIGIPASTIVAREAAKKDPGFVVIDEVAGQLFALLALSPTWAHGLEALVLFRLFDIFKPWPIRRLEKLSGGWGIMLDDLLAGFFAHIVLQLLLHFVPGMR
jgi:phosphatidylglycerophosphatase A